MRAFCYSATLPATKQFVILFHICRQGRRYQCLGHDMVTLNPRQEAFAQEVVRNGGDKVAARKAAGYSTKMTSAAQSVDADKLFNHAKISLRIAELQAIKMEVAEKEFRIDAGYVLRRFKEIDDLDILDIMEDDLSAFKPISEWPKVWRTSISGIDVKKIISGKDEPVEMLIEKIKWPDKLKNLELLGKHISVNAFSKEEEKGAADSIADSLAKLIENLPS